MLSSMPFVYATSLSLKQRLCALVRQAPDDVGDVVEAEGGQAGCNCGPGNGQCSVHGHLCGLLSQYGAQLRHLHANEGVRMVVSRQVYGQVCLCSC